MDRSSAKRALVEAAKALSGAGSGKGARPLPRNFFII